MRSEQVEFSGSQDARLAGRLDLPDASRHVFALFAQADRSDSIREA
jgi:hypothetical protein